VRTSGANNDRAERKKVMALAQAREIDAILVTELSRWGRSTQDLVQTLDDLHSWKMIFPEFPWIVAHVDGLRYVRVINGIIAVLHTQ
jgi:hypothetical protein